MPQCKLELDFRPQDMSVRLEIDGNTPVDVTGFVHDVDVVTLMAIKNQMGITDKPQVLTTPAPILSELSFEPFDVTVFLVSRMKIGISSNG